MQKSQTATEYLIILAVVIVIALVVVGVLGGIPSLGAGNSQRTAQTKLTNQDIGIVSYSVFDTGTKVTIRNNAPTTARVETIMINGSTCISSDLPATLLTGESTTITCTNIHGTTGTRYNLPINVTWSSEGTAFTQSGINIAGTIGSGNVTSSNNSGTTAVNGLCGPANGTTVFDEPTTGLCSAGTASEVSRNSYLGYTAYSWYCAGSNGGTNDSCSAEEDATACDSGGIYIDDTYGSQYSGCWYVAPGTRDSCDTVCTSHEGCIDGSVDTSSCSIAQALGFTCTSCWQPNAPMAPAIGSGSNPNACVNEPSGGIGAYTCSYEHYDDNWYRLCRCNS